jgi:hypothetical protein
MVAEESLVNLGLNDLEPAASHVSLADGLDLLKPILLAQLVKCVVGLVE